MFLKEKESKKYKQSFVSIKHNCGSRTIFVQWGDSFTDLIEKKTHF